MERCDIGKKIGTLTIKENLGGGFWFCVCDCGKEEVCSTAELYNRKYCSRDCMIMKRELVRRKTHGFRSNGNRERLYRIWGGMIERCENENKEGYKIYGLRGINVCDEWRNNYVAFRTWAIKNGYRDDLTIDRIDNDKGYSPDNCRWITWKEQANNKRNNKYITINGEKLTATQVSEKYNISYDALMERLKKNQSIDYILRPVRQKTTKSSCKNI